MRRRALGALVGLTILVVLGPGSASARHHRVEQYPNLVPMAPSGLKVGKMDEGELPALRFTASIWNRGDYAFELVGRPEDPLKDKTIAEQCIAWLTPRTCSERKSIGELRYHQAHGHYHFEDFALYELRRFRGNGTVNLGPRGLVVSSDKVSFCLQDVQQSADAEPPFLAPWPAYYGCFSGQGIQGISPGWIDIYDQSLPGQFIPLAGVLDGTYALVIHTDPGQRVFESDDTDNVSVTGVQLWDEGAAISSFCTSLPGSLVCDQPPETTEGH